MLKSLLIRYDHALQNRSYYEIRTVQNEVIGLMENRNVRFYSEIFNVDEDLDLIATHLFYDLIEYQTSWAVELAYCFATNVVQSGCYTDKEKQTAYKYRAFSIVFNPQEWDDHVWEACGKEYYTGNLERDNVYDILILGDVLMARYSDPGDKKLVDLERQIPNIMKNHREIRSEVHAIKEGSLAHQALYRYCVGILKNYVENIKKYGY